jgi:hypothetical protein
MNVIKVWKKRFEAKSPQAKPTFSPIDSFFCISGCIIHSFYFWTINFQTQVLTDELKTCTEFVAYNNEGFVVWQFYFLRKTFNFYSSFCIALKCFTLFSEKAFVFTNKLM